MPTFFEGEVMINDEIIHLYETARSWDVEDKKNLSGYWILPIGAI